jgi:hypothetical protein
MATHELEPHIEGWGIDRDPKDRPAVPKERIPARDIGVHWTELEIPRQVQNVPVLVSIERPGITPVFGTAAPLKGLSGLMRRAAFKWSESDLRHWLLLLAADRVDVVEGLVDDVRHGQLPNLFKEMGWRAELKHRPGRAMLKLAALTGGLTLGVVWLLKPRRRAFHL